MLASELPFEILCHIASFVGADKKSDYALVCKAWRIPFEESMWRIMNIYTKKKLEDACNTSLTYQSHQKAHGHLVRELTLSKRLHTSDKQLRILQDRFPNLRSLCIYEESVDHIDFGVTADWSIWGSLTTLKICMEGFDIEVDVKKFLGLLSFLPCLRRLEYIKALCGLSSVFTIDDFETLHRHLPQLRHLSTAMDLDNISANDIQTIEHTDPASRLTTAEIRVDHMDLRWLWYFSQKYPNIHTLEWKIINTQHNDDSSDKLLSMFPDISCAFPRLTKVIMKGESEKIPVHLAFWELIYRFRAPIKHLVYYLADRGNDPESLEHLIKRCMSACSRTLETLLLLCGAEMSDPLMIPNALGICTSLQSLNLEVRQSSVALDVIFDNCSLLRKLKVTSQRVSTRSTNGPTHGLIFLEIRMATVSSLLFQYISLRCQNLAYMRLASLNAFGPLLPNGILSLDMEHTCFERLELNCVRFYASPDDWTIDTAINFMALSQSSPCDKAPPLTWFHLHRPSRSGYQRDQIRALKNAEAKHSKRFFRAFERKIIKNPDSQRGVQRSNNGQVLKHLWKKDLPLGYARLNCRYLKSFVVDTNMSYSNPLWDNIYESLH
ncbi:hypothetical protein CLU79DRAFT_768415 [Phycomyces nitens]|nr:hypothetical protein CLU79DRAFT_768415 [Phycomyces nitens]